MKALLLRQRGKLRLSSNNVSLPSHPHQAVNVLATPEMFQLQAGTPWNNPVLPQVDSFVTAVSGQSCNLYWHAGSGSHVTTFRAGPPVSEPGNGTFVPASTWMGGWNFFGFFSHLFEFFWVWNREWYSYASLYLDGAMFFCWNLSFFQIYFVLTDSEWYFRAVLYLDGTMDGTGRPHEFFTRDRCRPILWNPLLMQSQIFGKW